MTVKVCARCVLPETFPGISFDEKGICNFCGETDKISTADIQAEYRNRFEHLLKEYRGASAHDVIMCYSGGKDSTYTMAVLKEKYELNILAVTMDNGFVSPRARENIQSVVENLGVDHILFKPRYDIMAKVFRRCAEEDIFPLTALEKASSICLACMGFVKYSTLRMSLERGIPFVAYGWSPGQAPITSSIINTGPNIMRMTQKSLFNPIYDIAGEDIRPYFLEEKHFDKSYRFPFYIHPLAFLDYDEKEIYKSIGKMGWKAPDDVDANSTNCLLNSLGNAIHRKRLGFHPYAFELANMVRDGYLDRQTALDRLNEIENPAILEIVRSKLSID